MGDTWIIDILSIRTFLVQPKKVNKKEKKIYIELDIVWLVIILSLKIWRMVIIYGMIQPSNISGWMSHQD